MFLWRLARDIRVWLFIITFLSVSGAGSVMARKFDLYNPLTVFYGLPMAASLMFILLSHEMGHFVAARKWGINVGGPYFIPLPFTPLGTLGAVISLKEQIPDRRALMDIAVSGPWAGIGASLAVLLASRYFTGSFVHPLNQLSFAALVGFLVTVINLIPLGQTDGGHLNYALYGERAKYISLFIFTATAVYVVLFPSIISPLVLLIFMIIFGFRHPPTKNDDLFLGRTREIIGNVTCVLYWALILLFGLLGHNF